GGVHSEGPGTGRRVPTARSVAVERARSGSRVVATGAVVEQGSSSIGCVVFARGVEQERRGTGRRILVAGIEYERSGAESGVIAAVGGTGERKPANCCIRRAGGQVKKGTLPLRSVKPRIATVW